MLPLVSLIRRPLAVAALFLIATLGCSGLARAGAATLPTGFVDDRMAATLSEPTGIAFVPDASAATSPRVLVVEQRTAKVKLIVGASVTTVGTVPNVTAVDNERGLLGIAVDPQWPQKPYVYVHYTDIRSGNHIAISRFTLTGDLSNTGSGLLSFNPTSRYDLMALLPDNASNHNGGTLRFGPDQMLYASLGDDATNCGAQTMSLLAGKILRLDVSRLPAGAGGPAPVALLIPPGNPFPSLPDSNSKLVWAYGLRNPFRFHIDAASGRLAIADVGLQNWEELDVADSGGVNFGWPMREGPAANMTCSGNPSLTSPIHSYDHGTGTVIIGAGIYRRPAIGSRRFPGEYEGDAFFLDYSAGFMRRLNRSGSTWAIAAPVAGQPSSLNWGTGFQQVSDALEMPDGSLWYCRQAISYAPNTGEIRRISSIATTAVDLVLTPGVTFAPPAPSPSRGPVALSWTQSSGASVRLVIFDAAGRVVRTLERGAAIDAGAHQRTWDGHDDSGAHAAPGLYFAKLQVGDAARHARIALVR